MGAGPKEMHAHSTIMAAIERDRKALTWEIYSWPWVNYIDEEHLASYHFRPFDFIMILQLSQHMFASSIYDEDTRPGPPFNLLIFDNPVKN
jgi:hypothetical protein